jgi:hypothetical protein
LTCALQHRCILPIREVSTLQVEPKDEVGEQPSRK